MFWHTLAYDVTHTSVSRTQHIIGRSEYIDWLAYYELKKEAEQAAVEDVKANRKKPARGKRAKTPDEVVRELQQQGR